MCWDFSTSYGWGKIWLSVVQAWHEATQDQHLLEWWSLGGKTTWYQQFTSPTNSRTKTGKKPYNMTREKKSWLKEELQKMLDVDIIRPSVSPFASSPLKKTGPSGCVRTIAPSTNRQPRFLSRCLELTALLMKQVDARSSHGSTSVKVSGRYIGRRYKIVHGLHYTFRFVWIQPTTVRLEKFTRMVSENDDNSSERIHWNLLPGVHPMMS